MSFEIIKTQGTKNSVGAFMVYDSDTDEYLFDAEGNNAWDTYQEALQVKERLVMDKKIIKTRVIFSKEDWNRMDREDAVKKECKLNKKKPFTRFQWQLISLGFKGVK